MKTLQNLIQQENNVAVLDEIVRIKQANKVRLQHYIDRHVPNAGGPIPVSMIFDCQVKRIHEYKRQQLNIL